MAIVPMANAVAGNVALAAEYNKVVANVVDLDARTTLVEAAVGGGSGEVPRKGGEWSFGAATQSITGGANTLLTQWSAVGTPSGVSHSAGVFTLTEAGLYAISASIRVGGNTDKWLWIAGTALTGDTWYKTSTSGNTFNLNASGLKRVGAGQQVRIGVFFGTTQLIQRETAGDFCPGVSIYKVGN